LERKRKRSLPESPENAEATLLAHQEKGERLKEKPEKPFMGVLLSFRS
jgi:hypothetical protein